MSGAGPGSMTSLTFLTSIHWAKVSGNSPLALQRNPFAESTSAPSGLFTICLGKRRAPAIVRLREQVRGAESVRNQTGKRKAVVIIRERNGRSLPAVFRTEGQALSFIRSRIAKGTIINADEGSSWDALHATYEMKRINHEEAYSLDGACTNWAEEFFSRMRRAETGPPSPYRRVHIYFATRKRHHGGKTIAACRMAIRFTWFLAWR